MYRLDDQVTNSNTKARDFLNDFKDSDIEEGNSYSKRHIKGLKKVYESDQEAARRRHTTGDSSDGGYFNAESDSDSSDSDKEVKGDTVVAKTKTCCDCITDIFRKEKKLEKVQASTVQDYKPQGLFG